MEDNSTDHKGENHEDQPADLPSLRDLGLPASYVQPPSPDEITAIDPILALLTIRHLKDWNVKMAEALSYINKVIILVMEENDQLEEALQELEDGKKYIELIARAIAMHTEFLCGKRTDVDFDEYQKEH